jgi:large subunit ribosomal protein L35
LNADSGRNKEVDMPKIKTNRGAAKRFRATGTGRLARKKAFANHILTKKTHKRKRKLRQGAFVHAADHKPMKLMVPYL